MNLGRSFVNAGGNLLGIIHAFKLKDDEYIVAIAGPAGRLVNQIQSIASSGRVSPKYGGGGGSPFLVKKKDRVLNYFFGRVAWRIDQIGAMFKRYVVPKCWNANTAVHIGGHPFDESVRHGALLGKIFQIRVCSNGSHVSTIETSYTNSGTYKNGGAHIFGIENGFTCTNRDDEYIAAIIGKATYIINDIAIVTSSGRVYGNHGCGGGAPFRIEKDKRWCVISLAASPGRLAGQSVWCNDHFRTQALVVSKCPPNPTFQGFQPGESPMALQNQKKYK